MLGVVRRNPLFRRLWVSQVVSQAGDWLNRMAVLALIGELSGGELGGGGAGRALGALFGIELALRLLPTALFSPLAGPLADRLSRRGLMITSDLCRAAVVLCLLTVDGREDLPLLYCLLFLLMSLSIFFDAARSATVPNTVPREDLLEAQTLSAVTWSTMLALGAFLGGVVLTWVGVTGVFLMDSATYVVSALLLIGLRLPAPPSHTYPFRLRDVFLAEDLRRALAHVRQLGLLPILAAKTLWGMAGGFLVLLSVLGTETFGLGGLEGEAPEFERLGRTGLAIGLLYAARGVGTGLGPVLARRWFGSGDRALARNVFGGFLVAAAGYSFVPLSQSLWLACLFVAIAHTGGSTIWVSSTVFWQRHVADEFRGRVHSLEFLGMTLSFSLWGLFVGRLADWTGSVSAAFWCTAGAAVGGAFVWTRLARGLQIRD
jgi:MFS family permease